MTACLWRKLLFCTYLFFENFNVWHSKISLLWQKIIRKFHFENSMYHLTWWCHLKRVYKCYLHMYVLHIESNYVGWLKPDKHVKNACVNGMWQRGFVKFPIGFSALNSSNFSGEDSSHDLGKDRTSKEKILTGLWSVVNFTNILQVAFVLIYFCQKITNPNCKHIKAAPNTFV